MTEQPSTLQLEILSFQSVDNHDDDNNQDTFQNPNPTLDNQSTDLTVNSNALLKPVRHVEHDLRRNTEQTRFIIFNPRFFDLIYY